MSSEIRSIGKGKEKRKTANKRARKVDDNKRAEHQSKHTLLYVPKARAGLSAGTVQSPLALPMDFCGCDQLDGTVVVGPSC